MTTHAKLRPAIAGMFVVVALAACGTDTADQGSPGTSPTPTASARSQKTFSLTKQDSGSTIQVIKGDRIEIALDANASTGFRWEYKSKPSAILNETRATYSPTPAPQGMVGSGGFQYYDYEVVGTGTASIELTYRGPSGDDGGSFTVTVVSA